MQKCASIDQILFPVETHPIHCVWRGRSPNEVSVRTIVIPDKQAVLNGSTGELLAVVSNDYQIVTNQQALEHARRFVKAALPNIDESEWRIENVHAGASGSYCYFDLTHNSTAFDFRYPPQNPTAVPDAYGPFLRVSNGYDAAHALKFEFGFMRKVCSNGLVMKESAIRLTYRHDLPDIRERLDAGLARTDIKQLQDSVKDYMLALRELTLNPKDFERLFFAALEIRKPTEKQAKNSTYKRAWNTLLKHVRGLRDRYTNSLGNNGYAVLNAVTDFASHPPPRSLAFRKTSYKMQGAAGSWISDFSSRFRKAGFDLSKYLDRIEAKAN